MRITLKEMDTFDELVLSKKPSSIEEALAMNAMVQSLQEGDVPSDMKEIEDISNISFGHFIILEQILGLEVDNKQKVKQIMPFLLRPKSEDTLDNEDQEAEAEFGKRVFELDYGTCVAAFNRFMEKRHEYLFKRFNGVIYATLDENEDDDEEEDDELLSDGAITAREFHNKKFYWYGLVGDVCGGDIFKRQDALELKMYEVMPFLAEKRSLAIVEALEAKSRRS